MKTRVSSLISLFFLLNLLGSSLASNFLDKVVSEFLPKWKQNESSHTSLEVIDLSGMEFCDGATMFTRSRTDCKYGYQFGNNTPKCICFKGLYRMILDDCFESDGLTEGRICTRPFDTQRESGAKIYNVQITQEINWDHTHVVCEKQEHVGQKIWSATSFHGREKTASLTLPGEEPDFYVINGVPYMLDVAAGKQAICVEEKYVKSFRQEKICRYFRNDNDAWRTDKAIDITIRRDKCPSIAKQMIPSECFPSVRDEASECQLRCEKKNEATPESETQIRSDSLFGKNMSHNLTRPESPSPSPSHEAAATRHENLFMDRKMLQYLLVSNIRDVHFVEPLLPNKTFELFNLLVNITTAFCPNHFVPSRWVNFVANLFQLIHSGDGLAYDETITDEDYKWSKDILDKCFSTATLKPIILTSKPTGEERITNSENNTNAGQLDEICGDDTPEAWGFCPDGNCNILDVKELEPHKSKSPAILKTLHYVPELAWNVLDISQAICFEDFNSSYRMFHIVQQAVEKLFTLRINNLWKYPPYIDIGSTLKLHLLGEGSDLIMNNLEMCTSGIYEIVNKAHKKKQGAMAIPIARLKRPDPESTLPERKKRSATPTSISPRIDAYCLQRSKDWKYPETCFAKNKP